MRRRTAIGPRTSSPLTHRHEPASVRARRAVHSFLFLALALPLSGPTAHAAPSTAHFGTEDATAAVTGRAPPVPVVSIEWDQYRATEGGAVGFWVKRTGDTAAGLTVALSVTETGAMMRGTAPTAASFPAGAAVTPLLVRTENDEFVENASVVTASLAAGSGYTVDANAASAAVTIEDDDAAPVVTTATPIEVPENRVPIAALHATDADTPAGSLVWSVVGGADIRRVLLSPAGVLAFRSPADFEAPDDSDEDGDYEIVVRVTDGANPVSVDVTVRLVDVDEGAPTPPAAFNLAYENVLIDSERRNLGARLSWSAPETDPEVTAWRLEWQPVGLGQGSRPDRYVPSRSYLLAVPPGQTVSAGDSFSVELDANSAGYDFKWNVLGSAGNDSHVFRVVAVRGAVDHATSEEVRGRFDPPHHMRTHVRSVVEKYAADHPWIGETLDYLESNGIPIRYDPGRDTAGVAIYCIAPGSCTEAEIYWVRFTRVEHSEQLIVHELGHVYSEVGVADLSNRVPVTIAYLYLYEVVLAAVYAQQPCSGGVSELFADLDMIVTIDENPGFTNPDPDWPNAYYWHFCRSPRKNHQEAVQVVRSALAGDVPAWLRNTFLSPGGRGLDGLWKLVDRARDGFDNVGSSVVNMLRNEFGGYCRPGFVSEYDQKIHGRVGRGEWSIGNPWRDGGCVPGVPVELAAVVDGTAVDVQWSAPANVGASPVSEYRVQWRTAEQAFSDVASDGRSASVQAASRNFVIPFDLASPIASARVRALNDEGEGAWQEIGVTAPSGPSVASATVSGTSLRIGFGVLLDEASIPAADAFAVTVGGAARGVDSVEVMGSVVGLTLSSAVAVGETATVGYTVPTGANAGPIRDLLGNPAAGFPGRTVTNETPNTPPVGLPSIEGEAKVGYTLTASAAGISDADGLTRANFAWQWIATHWTGDEDIAGATGSTYTPTAADVGATVKVRVTFTDGGGTQETLVSEETATVEVSLTARFVNVPPSHDGSTRFTYALHFSEAVRWLLPNSVSIGGGVVWQALQIPDSSGNFGYTRWQITIEPESDGDISLALEVKPCALDLAVCTPDWRQLAESVSVTVPGPASVLPEVSVAAVSSPVKEGAEAVFTLTRTGAAAAGLTVSVSVTESASMLAGVPPGVVGFTAGSATAELRVATEDDAVTEAASTVTASVTAGTGYAVDVQAGSAAVVVEDDDASNTAPTGLPAIAGIAQVGETLTASASGISDADGLANAVFAWQWVSNDGTSDTDIAGATASSYTLTSAEAGRTVKVRVTFTDDGGTQESLVSAATAAVTVPLTARFASVPESHEGAASFTLELHFSEGIPLSFRTLRDLALEVGGGAVRRAKRLTSGSNLGWRLTVGPDGQDAVSIVLPSRACTQSGAVCTSDGRALAEGVSATVPGPATVLPEVSVTAVTSPVKEGAEAVFTLTRTGAAAPGLTVSVSVTESGSMLAGVPPGVVGFTAGSATAELRVATEDDAVTEAASTVTASVTAGTGYAVDVQAGSAAVVVEDDDASNTAPSGLPAIAGIARVGETLTASAAGISDADGLANVVFAWQWVSNDGTSDTDIAGATASSYTLTSAEAGRTVKVRVTFTDDGGTQESLVSAATAAVPSPATVLPEVSVTAVTSPVTEGAEAVFTLNRTGGAASALEVAVSVTKHGVVVSDAIPVRFGAGSSTTQLRIATADDEMAGGGGVVTVAVQAGAGYVVASNAGEASVTVHDDDHAPSIVDTGPFTVEENTTPVATLAATDGDTPVADLVWSVAGGADAPAFELSAGGVLAFKSAKDHEAPDDADANGEYAVTVQVSDGVNDTQAALVVRVSDVDEVGPVLAHATVDGAVLTLTWDEALDETSTPPAGAFAVTVDGASRAVDSVEVKGRTVTLRLVRPVAAREAVSASYTVPADPGTDPVRDTAGNAAGGFSGEVVTNSTAPNTPATGEPVISGTARVGETLTASASGILDADGLANAVFAWQWVSNDGTSDSAIAGATTSSYTLASAEVGRTVKVRVTFTDDRGARETLVSAATAAVEAALPVVSVEAEASPVTEGSAAVFVLRRTGVTARALEVVVATAEDGSVLSGTPAPAVTFAPGSAATWLRLATDDDAVTEADGRVTVSLAPGSGYEVDAVAASAGVDVYDDDEAATSGHRTLWSATLTVYDFFGVIAGYYERIGGALSRYEWSEDGRQFRVDKLYHYIGGSVLVFDLVSAPREPGELTLRLDDRQFALASVEGTRLFTWTVEDLDWHDGRTVAVQLVRADPDAAVVAGPGLSVADAVVREAEGAVLEFQVTLDGAQSSTVSVRYATSDDTATAGTDYVAQSGALRFAPGEASKTVRVPVLNDAHDEGPETLTLSLSHPFGAMLADGEATGTIVNTGPIPKAWIARFGRSVAGHVLGAVETRLTAPGGDGTQLTIAGRRVNFDGASRSWTRSGPREWRDGPGPRPGGASFDGEGAPAAVGSAVHGPGWGSSRDLGARELLTGTSFRLTSERRERDGRWTLWGQGAWTDFNGRDDDGLSVGGDVATGMVGADYRAAGWLGGILVSHSVGTGTYALDGASDRSTGELESSVSGLFPYAGIDLTERLSAWGVGGHGRGTMKLTAAGDAALETDVTLSMAAGGMRGEVLAAGAAGGLGLALQSDALFTRIGSEGVVGLHAADANVSRLRLGLEGSYTLALDGGGRFEPSLELGVRHDGGDAETGFGVELGGGLRHVHPSQGLSADFNARWLLAHEDRGYDEWGASGSLRFDPGGASSDLGPSLAVTRSWGVASSGGTESLLGRSTMAGIAARDQYAAPPAEQLGAELRFGFPLPSAGRVAVPYLAAARSGDGRMLRLGSRLRLHSASQWHVEGEFFEGERTLRLGYHYRLGGRSGFGVEATRREGGTHDAPGHRLWLRGVLRW